MYLTQKRLSVQKGLNNGAGEGDHGKTAVDNFLFLTVPLEFLTGSGPAGWFPSDLTGLSFSVVKVEGGGLNNSNGHENLNVSGESNTGDSSEDVSVGELVSWDVESCLLGNNSAKGKHAHTSVLQFSPTSILQVSLDVRPDQLMNGWQRKQQEKVSKPQISIVDGTVVTTTSDKLFRSDTRCTYSLMGSNPISPAMDPSSFSGRTKKGMDLDISSAFKATEAFWAC